MSFVSRRLFVAVAVVGLFLSLSSGASAAKTLDDGLLDPAWFGSDLPWHATHGIDYLWVADGFSLKGKTLEIADWEKPEFRNKKERDAKDSARAYELTDRMPGLLRGAIEAVADPSTTVVKEGGDVVLVGRFVDVNAGNRAAKWLVGFGAGSATATWDLKLVDAKSGKVLAAIHHRAISGTNMSDIDDKIVKWLDDDFGQALKEGLGAAYASGRPVKK